MLILSLATVPSPRPQEEVFHDHRGLEDPDIELLDDPPEGRMECDRVVESVVGGGNGSVSCDEGVMVVERWNDSLEGGHVAGGYGHYGWWDDGEYKEYQVEQIDVGRPYALDMTFRVSDFRDGEWLRFSAVVVIRDAEGEEKYVEWDVWRGARVPGGRLVFGDAVEYDGFQASRGEWYSVRIPFWILVEESWGPPTDVVWAYFVIESASGDGMAQIAELDLHNLSWASRGPKTAFMRPF